MTTQGGSYSWNATCDVCGFQYKAQDLKKRWDGLMVCEADFERRHPLDFYRVKSDHHQLPFIRKDDAANTGFLPSVYPSTTPPSYISDDTIGSKFTVGTATRRLLGVRIGGINEDYKYIKTLPIIVKLWDSLFSVLTSWTIKDLRYKFVNASDYTEVTTNLTPSYVLAANTVYYISIYCTGYNGIPSTSAIGTAGNQPFVTFNGAYGAVGSDDSPNTPFSGDQATAYLDIITGSTN